MYSYDVFMHVEVFPDHNVWMCVCRKTQDKINILKYK